MRLAVLAALEQKKKLQLENASVIQDSFLKNLKVGHALEYKSVSAGRWIPCKVKKITFDGSIEVDVKERVFFSAMEALQVLRIPEKSREERDEELREQQEEQQKARDEIKKQQREEQQADAQRQEMQKTVPVPVVSDLQRFQESRAASKERKALLRDADRDLWGRDMHLKVEPGLPSLTHQQHATNVWQGLALAATKRLPLGTGILADFISRVAKKDASDVITSQQHTMVLAEVGRESIYSKIMEVLTPFWKTRQRHPLWTLRAAKRFKDRCKTIMAFERQRVCLRAEFQYFNGIVHLRNAGKVLEQAESFEERRQRVQGFWLHYQARRPGETHEKISEEWRSPRLELRCRSPNRFDEPEPQPLMNGMGFNVNGCEADTPWLWNSNKNCLREEFHPFDSNSFAKYLGQADSRAQAEELAKDDLVDDFTFIIFFRPYYSNPSWRNHVYGISCNDSPGHTTSDYIFEAEASVDYATFLDQHEDRPKRMSTLGMGLKSPRKAVRHESDRGASLKVDKRRFSSEDSPAKGYAWDEMQVRPGYSETEGRLESAQRAWPAIHLLPLATPPVVSADTNRPATGGNPARRRRLPYAELMEEIAGSVTQTKSPRKDSIVSAGKVLNAGNRPTMSDIMQSGKPSPRLRLCALPVAASTAITPSASNTSLYSRVSQLGLPKVPYEPPGGGVTISDPDSPQLRYLESCHASGLPPMAIPFVTGHSKKFNVSDQSLRDCHLAPITVMVREMENIEELDLSGNNLLTDKSLAPFLQTVIDQCRKASLWRLNFSRCLNLSQGTLKVINSAITQQHFGLTGLMEVNLSGIQIGMGIYVSFAYSIGRTERLKKLLLSDTGLGRAGADKQVCTVIRELLRDPALEHLDIGWNIFRSEAFAHLGACLAHVHCLQDLCVANCSGTSASGLDVPIEYFLERLGKSKTLTRLDISLNHIDYRGALIIEDVLDKHRSLKELKLCDNPCGVQGLRCILRLLTCASSNLSRIDFEGSADAPVEQDEDAQQILSLTSPCGRYSLDLARPYHRSLLRMLYKLCEKCHYKPPIAFSDLSFSHPPYKHAHKDDSGCWAVPSRGKLKMAFVMSWTESLKSKSTNRWGFHTFLEQHTRRTRLEPSFHRIVPLFATWRTLRTLKERLGMLDALALDFQLTFPQVAELRNEHTHISNDILRRTMHCLVGGQLARYLTISLTPSLGQYLQNVSYFGNLLTFNAENPTWHYQLDLANHSDYAVAESLLLLDRWEVEIDKHLSRADVSQWGDRSHIRNVEFQGRTVRSVAEWNLVRHDCLIFDYASGKRPLSDSPALDPVSFNQILQVLEQDVMDYKIQVDVLRSVSNWIFLSALQLRELLGVFRKDRERADVFVVFCFQIVDMWNEKVCRVRFDDTREVKQLWGRLGHATLFPFMQPEFVEFKLDLACFDQRLAALFLFLFMAKEGSHNLQNASLSDPDSEIDQFEEGLPHKWETLADLPQSGILSATYMCAPSERNFAERKRLLQTFGHQYDGQAKLGIPEKDVRWWSAISDAPLAVQKFMEYVLRYTEVKGAFLIITKRSGKGKGPIKFSEFQEGFKDLECKKLAGSHNQQYTSDIWDFLDSSGGNSVSESDWVASFTPLWEEMTLCLKEFGNFLSRAFNHNRDFLELAWKVLDNGRTKAKLGNISKDEWPILLKSKLNYFGPSAIIFDFLDRDEAGIVTLQKMRMLQTILGNIKGAPPKQQGTTFFN